MYAPSLAGLLENGASAVESGRRATDRLVGTQEQGSRNEGLSRSGIWYCRPCSLGGSSSVHSSDGREVGAENLPVRVDTLTVSTSVTVISSKY